MTEAPLRHKRVNKENKFQWHEEEVDITGLTVIFVLLLALQLAFTWSNSTTETPEQYMKSVQG